MRSKKILIFLILISTKSLYADSFKSEDYNIQAEIISDQLEHPWSLVFLPSQDILISERTGNLRKVTKAGFLQKQPIQGLPDIKQNGQGGLLDLAIHPLFKENRLLYFSFSEETEQGLGTAVAYGTLEKNKIKNVKVIFRLTPKSNTNYHFGSRLIFDKDNFLYITLGDRGSRPRAQNLNDHAGSIIRIYDDGSIPEDNPFFNLPGHKQEIFSYGHRNVQGIAIHPTVNAIWAHEHGPQGGDELNIVTSGTNYGWPVITYGKNYVFGTDIGEGTHKKGMAQPIRFWVPSIAPSGMIFYTGDKFKKWRGNLLIGSLKFQQLVRLKLKKNDVVTEERLFSEKFGRIRDVKQGPNGYIYLLTDSKNGKLIKLKPQ
tara:strand:- start:8226 stop:9341 length:1116 start_codon:yes stop_codon:yes gene_type:complete